jgi:ABC-2 type transport system permease protein
MKPAPELAIDALPRARQLSAFVGLIGLTFRQYLHGRKLLVLVLLYALPCGLTVLLRSLRDPPPAHVLEFALVFNLVPHVLAPLTALLYASGMIQDEVEGQTLIYLVVRPLPRWALYLGRAAVTLVISTLVTVLGTAALYVSIYAGAPPPEGTSLPVRIVQTGAVLALAQVCYCGLFGGLSMILRRSLVAGVIYIALFEGLVANIDFIVRRVTVVYYFRILVLRWLEVRGFAREHWERAWKLDLEEVADASTCVRNLLIAGLAFTLLSAFWFTTREFRMKTPEGA